MPIALVTSMGTRDSRLKFIEARWIETPVGRLDRAPVISPTNATLGTLDGVLVDPGARRIAFYVVESAERSRHFLVPQMPARLDASHQALEVDLEADNLDELDVVEPAKFPRFSDGDLMNALFRAHTR
jgi:hypothetical protein